MVLIKEDSLDLLLVDLESMPVEGLALLQHLRDNPSAPPLLIFALVDDRG